MNRLKLFTNLPSPLRDELVDTYEKISLNFLERKWEPAELNGGKFCEVVFSIISGSLVGSFPKRASKPKNVLLDCQNLEKTPKDPNRVGDHSLRILIPRILPALYDVRSNRGVGHVGGDVNPNYMDAVFVYSSASWIMAELVRIFHGLDTVEAQLIVDNLVERKIPAVWQIEDRKRILDVTLSKSDQTLLLLYSENGWVNESELCIWIEHSNLSVYRRDVLRKLHKKRYIEYSKETSSAFLSPLGASHVEENILGQ